LARRQCDTEIGDFETYTTTREGGMDITERLDQGSLQDSNLQQSIPRQAGGHSTKELSRQLFIMIRYVAAPLVWKTHSNAS
jgi:hypothetical protein